MNLPDLTRRQQFRARVHISTDHGPVLPRIDVTAAGPAIASVEIIDGLAIQSPEPEALRNIGKAFLLAADRLDHPSATPASLSVVQ